jgi:hypothetical protein
MPITLTLPDTLRHTAASIVACLRHHAGEHRQDDGWLDLESLARALEESTKEPTP